MQGKLQELTEKLYNEGVGRAREEAERILAEARQKAEALVAAARREIETARAVAERDVAELRRNVESEIRMAAQQATGALKARIAGLVTAGAVDMSVTAALSDVEVVKQLILEIVRNAGSGLSSLRLEVPVSMEENLRTWFASRAFAQLSGGIEIKADSDLAGGFRIGPGAGAFVVSFTDEGFAAFFGDYLRPRARRYLFGDAG